MARGLAIRAVAWRAARRGAARTRDRTARGAISSRGSASQRRWQRALNVTLAVRNAPATFAASTHDCKRVAKEADSAWLRFGPEPQALDAASDPRRCEPNTVLLWSDAGTQSERSIGETIAAFAGFRGHVAIDESSGAATIAGSRRAARVAHARSQIQNTQPHIASCARGDRTCVLAGGCGPGADPAGMSPSRSVVSGADAP